MVICLSVPASSKISSFCVYSSLIMIATAALVLLLPIQSVASTQSTYYISPASESQCPESYQQNCLTLSEYASEMESYPASDALTLRFLPGKHALTAPIHFELFVSVTLLGNHSLLPNITSMIVCNGVLGRGVRVECENKAKYNSNLHRTCKVCQLKARNHMC